MRVLRVISTMAAEAGGPVEGVKQLDNSLRSLGVVTEIACCDSPPLNVSDSANGSSVIHYLGPSSFGYRYSKSLIPWLKDNAGRFDAVIVNGIWQFPSLATHRVFAKSPVPYFVFTHGMLDPWFKKEYPLKHLKKWLYWPWAEYRVLRDAENVIFTSEEERICSRKSFWLYRAREVVTAYGTAGLPAEFQGRENSFFRKHPDLQGKRILLFLSRLHEKKGCDLLVKAFAQVCSDPNLHLAIAGTGDPAFITQLKSLASDLGLESRVSWLGMLRGEDKWNAFRAAEVFCLPSHQENFGIVVAEALSCGKPVLISNKINIWREILQADAGFVDDDSVDGTVRNLKKWISLSSVDTALMSLRARQCFENDFHISKAATRLFSILSDGISAHRSKK